MAAWLLLLVAFAGAPTTPGNQCVIFDKPEELWAVNDLVFLGTVVATRPTGIEGFHVTVDVATFRVDRVWKGKPDRQVQIGGDAFFEKGKQYLVFASGKPPSTSLRCRSSEPADRAKAKIDWLIKRGPVGQLMRHGRPHRTVFTAVSVREG
jgi:hypothetical protein